MLLSIVTPVLNGKMFIRKNIESIMKLKTPHEHIIVDGGSADGTLDILKEYPHLKILYQNTQNGMYGAIDQGFNSSKGDIITWINCDDYVIPDKYDEMVNKMIEKDADFCYSDAYIFFEMKKQMHYWKSSILPKFFLKRGLMPFIQPSSLYKKNLYNKYVLNPKYKIIGDMDMFFRMSADDKAVFLRCKYPTVVFLKYGNSLGDKNVDKSHKELKAAGIPPTNVFTICLFHFLRRFF